MLNSIIALAQNESDFYTPQTGGIIKNLVLDYGADNSFITDDSPKLQTAIDAVSAAGGGRIVIPLGNYSFAEISLKSNVRLEIDKGAVIRPTDRADQSNYAIFNVGDASTVNNVSISGIGGSFNVDISLTNYTNVTVIRCQNANNFQFAFINVIDNYTKFAAIAFGYTLYNGTYYGPTNGVVKNANIENAQWGYGLIQTQVGNHILFKNLSGNGGSTLRLETGFTELNQLQILGLYDIVGRNINVKNGNAAVQVSPHCMKNGKFDIDTVNAVNSSFAVLIAKGYQRSTETNLQPGYFASTSVINHVTATYGTTAQLKAKDFGYVPCPLRNQISPTFNPDGESQAGPAIVAVLDIAGSGTGAGYFTTTFTNVAQTGFNYQPKTILGESDFVKTCSTSLPIVLSAFDVKLENKVVCLNWITLSEKNNNYFEILRSLDGKSFISLGRIKSAGNNDVVKNYEFIDGNPGVGLIYYKLQQVDFDGSTIQSDTKVIDSKLSETTLTVYADQKVNIIVKSPNNTLGLMILSDISGKNIVSKKILLEKGINNLSFENDLNAGIYFVQILAGGKCITQKFIK